MCAHRLFDDADGLRCDESEPHTTHVYRLGINDNPTHEGEQ